MIRHYLKLIWNRKRSNLLIVFEIFLSFLVLFAVGTLALHYASNYRRPLGFDYNDVWNIQVAVRAGGETEETPPEVFETFRQIHAAVREFPEVVGAAGVMCPPYGNSNWNFGDDVGGRTIRFGMSQVTDGYSEVMRLELVEGRWFDARDDGMAETPVVINEQLARDVFPGGAVGKTIPRNPPTEGRPADPDRRVVGVVSAFRQDGEFAPPGNYLFSRRRLDDPTGRPESNVIVRLRPGTTAAFEERLVKRLQAVAPEWSFEVKPLDLMRKEKFTEILGPVIAAAVIAAFLLLMVALGLTGVLWQMVTQRTREIGLRRAQGATVGDVRSQVLGELVVMTSVAVLAGAAIVVQFPLLKLLGVVSPGVYLGSLALSTASIYLLTMACAWYPARLATTVQPAEALHYE
jgi:putative ABC transport system permease protein